MSDWIRYLGAGIAVYVAMAACSAGGGPTPATEDSSGASADSQPEATGGAAEPGNGRGQDGAVVAAGGAAGTVSVPGDAEVAGTAGSLVAALVEPVPVAAGWITPTPARTLATGL